MHHEHMQLVKISDLSLFIVVLYVKAFPNISRSTRNILATCLLLFLFQAFFLCKRDVFIFCCKRISYFVGVLMVVMLFKSYILVT